MNLLPPSLLDGEYGINRGLLIDLLREKLDDLWRKRRSDHTRNRCRGGVEATKEGPIGSRIGAELLA
jgi:hypothetical protein